MLLNCKQLTNIEVFLCDNLFGNCFKELKELKYLSVGYCDNITDNGLTHLNNLESLNIKRCKNITGICLQNLEQLQILTIDVFSGIQLKYLKNLISLKHLDIKININKTNEEMKNTSFLCNLINLEFLKIKSNKDFIFRDEDFYNLKNLKILKISNTKKNVPEFTGKCFQYFPKLDNVFCNFYFELNYLTNIKYLNLKHMEKHIYFNEVFSNLKTLEKLKLISKFEITINNDKNDLQLFTNLKHLKIRCSAINGDFNNFPNLTKLELFAVEIKDKQIMNLEKLITLIINNCPSITGECFLNLKHLQDLSIYCCYSINFKYLSNLTSLTNLSVSESEIEDKDLIELNNMKYLDMR
ncbi:hypothetical protein ABK040_004324 [Willaertia magna]